ncbi:MAG TPA: hypothetical protein VF623_07710 [Segetibacter sp.]|jgi:hypothetical protein
MNCDKDFYIPYNLTYVKVKPFCESSDVHYKVYLPEGETKVQPYNDEQGIRHWHLYNHGETELAKELGKLIEEQEKDTNPVVAEPEE